MGCLAHYLAQVDEPKGQGQSSLSLPASRGRHSAPNPPTRTAAPGEKFSLSNRALSTCDSAAIDGAKQLTRLSLPMAAISQRVAGPCGPATATRLPGRRTAVIAAAAAKGARRARELEGASEELRATAAQCLDWAPARRRVRAAFAPVLPTLNHCLFKVRKPRCSSFGFVSCAVAVGPSCCQYLFSFTLVSV
jgi:hypothetical protein